MTSDSPSIITAMPASSQPPAIALPFRTRGFLPETDPLTTFPTDSEFAMLDELGRHLPSLLYDRGFRQYAKTLKIPVWRDDRVRPGQLPELRLYYVRIGFLVSAYINQVGEQPANVLPANLAIPLCRACELLGRPPILSYDGYALYNWKRFRQDGPIAPGNLDTIQNFVHLYDEHWFILVHIEIEAIAARILDAIAMVYDALSSGNPASSTDAALWAIAGAITDQIRVLRRIPEHMDPALYFKTFRPYIRFFENVTYETSAQTSTEVENSAKAASAGGPYELPRRDWCSEQHHADPGRLHEAPAQTVDAN